MNREALTLLWQQAFGEMDERLADIQPRVVRWEWAEDIRHSLRPLQFERFGRRGRELTEQEVFRRSGAAFEYGFAADDRLLIIQDPYPGGPYPSVYYYMDDVTTAITYHAPTGIPWVVEQAEYQDGRQAAYGRLVLGSWIVRPGFNEQPDPDALLDRYGFDTVVENVAWDDGKIVLIDGEAGGFTGKMDRYVVRPDKNLHAGPE